MTAMALRKNLVEAELATMHSLLRCWARETGSLRIGGTLVRCAAEGGLALRFKGVPTDTEGTPLDLARLLDLIRRAMPGDNAEFAAQVANSQAVLETILTARAFAEPPSDPWLASEQALSCGHPFHPSPKARSHGWLHYAPETHASFPLRLLGVAGSPEVLPVHPWQMSLLADELAAPLRDGRLVDLGYSAGVVHPTSSVRTVYDPIAGLCRKFSLNVRITNCVRKNAWYELEGAVALTRLLTPVFADLATLFPGTRWLAEPRYQSADLGLPLLEGLGVIERQSPWDVVGRGVTPLLAGALALQGPVGDRGWWRAYVERVVPPVLHAFFAHGVVLEPHLQNVLVGVDVDGLPVEAIFRDMEGTKLVGWDLSALHPRVAASMTYDRQRGWDRVVYCLFVNHLAEIAATVAGPSDSLLHKLWTIAREVIEEYASAFGRPLPLAGLLGGDPLPAKANLGVRWARSADRDATYVPVPNPLSGDKLWS